MSFASDVKKEVITNDFDDIQLKAELYGFLKQKSEIAISNNQLILKIKTTSLTLSRRIIFIIKRLYDINIEILQKKRENLDKKNLYILLINDNIKTMLMDLEIMDSDYNFIDEMSESYSNHFEDVLRGMFIARGSVNDPAVSRYHLEIACNESYEVDYIIENLLNYGIEGKKSKRREYYVFYVKKGEQIGDFLKLIGATSTLFDFENDRIRKDLNNVVNRVSNCDLANGTRAMATSDRQMEHIRIIKKYMGFDNLSIRLMEAITLRVKNEGSSLQELSDLSEEVVGRYISKSGLQHCMKDLEIIANSLINENKNKKK